MRASLLLLACVACGRLDFAELADASPGVAPTATHSDLTLLPPQEAMVDFPLLVVLDDTRADRTLIGDGATLRFLDGSGTVVPHEIEQLGAPGGAPLVAWVRVQVPTSGATITVEYGPGVPDPSTGTVWSPEFAAVWHFAADGTVHDSTNHGLDLTAVGTHTGSAMAGAGVDLAGVSTQYLVSPAATMSPTVSAFTVSAFVWMRAFTVGFQGAVTRQFGSSSDNDIYLGTTSTNAVMTCETSVTESDIVGAKVLATQTWYYLTGTADSVTAKVFVDGTVDGMMPIGRPLVSNPLPLFVGADRSASGGPVDVGSQDFLNGIIDEARVQTVARSDAWVAYDARAVRDQVITYGPIVRP